MKWWDQMPWSLFSLCKPLAQPDREKTKRKKEFNLEAWEKETSNTVRLKKKKAEEKQINTTKMKEQTTNTEVQINEEEIGKLLKKNSE